MTEYNFQERITRHIRDFIVNKINRMVNVDVKKSPYNYETTSTCLETTNNAKHLSKNCNSLLEIHAARSVEG